MKMKQAFSMLLSVVLSLQVMSVFATASTSQEPPFLTEEIELEVETKKDKATSSSQKMEYEIDVFSKKEKKKVGTLNLTFDYNFSPEKAQAEIKNPTIKVVDEESPWEIKSEVFGMAGSGTDLAAIEYQVSATKNEKYKYEIVYYSNSFTLTADKNGQTKILYPKNMNLDRYALNEYIEYGDKIRKNAKCTGVDEYGELVKEYEPVVLDSVGITYQIKEYQAEPYELKDTKTTKEKRKVNDMVVKSARYEVSIFYDGECLGREAIDLMHYYYSPSENYASIVVDAYQMEGYKSWDFDDSNQRTAPNEVNVGRGSELTFFGDEIDIRNKEDILCTLRLTVTADAKGNLTMKPILAL